MVSRKKGYGDFAISSLLVVWGLFFSVLNYIYKYPVEYVYPTLILVLLISAYLTIKYRNSWELLIIFVFMFYYNYSIVMAEFVLNINDFFTSYASSIEARCCLNIILFYMVLLCMFSPRKKDSLFDKNKYYVTKCQNDVIVFFIIILLCLILIFSYSRPEANERGETSPLYEYSIIFFIIGYYYASNKYKKVLSVLLFVFVLQNFVFGGRVTGVQLLIVWFLINYAYKAVLHPRGQRSWQKHRRYKKTLSESRRQGRTCNTRMQCGKIR